MNIEVIANEGQSFFDLALQGGSINCVFAITDNQSITDNVIVGKLYNVNVLDKQISNYYQKKELQPATAITLQQIEQTPIIGIGTMIIGNNFIVAP